MKYEVIINEISSDVAPGAAPVVVGEAFKQRFDNLDLQTLVLALNKRPRTRKAKNARPGN